MCRVIAVVNEKGGVAKTNVTANIAAAMANAGKKVLVIDADPQGSLTISLGFRDTDEIEITLTTMLAKAMRWEPFIPEEGILHQEEGIDLLPCNIELCGMEMSMVGATCRETLLRRYISSVRSKYDYIIIDCMPSLGIITLNALTCADSVLIPVEPEYLSAKGLEQLLETIRNIQEELNPDLQIDGILFTKVDYRTNDTKTMRKAVQDAYGEYVHVFRTEIPLSVKVKEATRKGISVIRYCPKGKAAKAYTMAAEEVLGNE